MKQISNKGEQSEQQRIRCFLCSGMKGTVNLKIKIACFTLPVVLCIHLDILLPLAVLCYNKTFPQPSIGFMTYRLHKLMSITH